MRAANATVLLAVFLVALRAENIDKFFEDFTAHWVRGDPNLSTRLGYFKGEEQDRLNRRITPLTRKYSLERIALARRGLQRLKKFDRSAMTETQRLSAEVLEWQLRAIAAEEPFLDFGLPPLNQFDAANTELPGLLISLHAVTSEREAKSYLARLRQVEPRMNEVIVAARTLDGRGILPPRFILEATIGQMRGFIQPPPEQNPLITSFARKMGEASAIPAEKRSRLLHQAIEIVARQVYPVWRAAVAVLESQLPRSANQAGLSRFQEGPAAYANRLRYYTTTNLTAGEIHEIGLKEVERLEREMDGIFRQLGRGEGSIAQRLAQLRAERMYSDPGSEASREMILKDLDAVVRDAERRAEPLFDIRPKAALEVQPAPTFLENNAAARYYEPAANGSRPGIYEYPRSIGNMSKVGIRSVSYHEGVPGHHFMLALQQENRELPAFRRHGRAISLITAFHEGWALYAERLAVEDGWYEGDPEGLLDALDAQLFRARRLVVDTGLHTKGWTRQQAIDYGMPVSEVERYVVWPGQACAYMIGQLKIVELREKARKQLGERFSLREFHNLVLTTGIVPLELLERRVDAYIQSQRGAH